MWIIYVLLETGKCIDSLVIRDKVHQSGLPTWSNYILGKTLFYNQRGQISEYII